MATYGPGDHLDNGRFGDNFPPSGRGVQTSSPRGDPGRGKRGDAPEDGTAAKRTRTMTHVLLERRRTGVDLVVGVLLILAALFLLGNVVLATALSVRVLGWTALVGGVVLLVRAFVGARAGASWPSALGGVVLAVLGLFMLRNPAIGALK